MTNTRTTAQTVIPNTDTFFFDESVLAHISDGKIDKAQSNTTDWWEDETAEFERSDLGTPEVMAADQPADTDGLNDPDLRKDDEGAMQPVDGSAKVASSVDSISLEQPQEHHPHDDQAVIFEGGTSEPFTGVAYLEVIYGDGNNNIIVGSDLDGLIYGEAGNDTVFGNGGVDHLHGGTGDDEVHGGAGDDRIWGGEDNDVLFGGDGIDRLVGGEGDDELHGGTGNDWLRGTSGTNTMYGDEGVDTISGGTGADTIFGGADGDFLVGFDGDDFIDGGEGDDVISDAAGDDVYVGGQGADTFWFKNHLSAGTGGNDTIQDFELGVDTLKILQPGTQFSGLTFNEYVDQFTSGGGALGVVLEWEGGLIRLAGVVAQDLTPWDIEFL